MERTVQFFADKFLEIHTEAAALLNEYLDFEGVILGHCFFPAAINLPLEKLLQANSDHGRIRHYVGFIQEMFETGNEQVQNIVEVSLIEHFALGSAETLKRLRPYLSRDLQLLADELHRF